MEKKFDSVKFQRKIREELSKKYNENRESFLKELKKKYGHLQKQKVGAHSR
jgi:ribosomal protein L29